MFNLPIIAGLVAGIEASRNPLRALFGLVGMALFTAYCFATRHIPDPFLTFGFFAVLFGAIDLLRYFNRTDKPRRAKAVGNFIVAFVGYSFFGIGGGVLGLILAVASSVVRRK